MCPRNYNEYLLLTHDFVDTAEEIVNRQEDETLADAIMRHLKRGMELERAFYTLSQMMVRVGENAFTLPNEYPIFPIVGHKNSDGTDYIVGVQDIVNWLKQRRLEDEND